MNKLEELLEVLSSYGITLSEVLSSYGITQCDTCKTWSASMNIDERTGLMTCGKGGASE